jgi:hypothetical protein
MGRTRPATTGSRWRKIGIWDRLFATVSRAYDGDLQMVDSSSIGSVRGRGGNSERVTV